MNNAFTKEVMPMLDLDLQNDKNSTLNNETNTELNNINHVTIIDDTVDIVENNILTDTTINPIPDDINTNVDTPEPNCLALTVRKDYNLVIVKNIFTASGRLSWKIVLSTIILNILNMLF